MEKDICKSDVIKKFYPEYVKYIQHSIMIEQMRQQQQQQKWVETFSGHFTKEDIQITNKHMKISSKLLVLRESQMKTIVS